MIGGTTSLSIIINAVDNASKTLKNTGDNLAATGAKMESAGKGLTMGLTLPLVGAGVASIKSAADFENAAKQVGATANLTADEVKKLADGVEDMAKSTGESTDSVFFAMQKAVSGSLNLGESQELVEKTTKAAAAGFGENERLVDVTTTAYDLFGESAGSAGAILDDIVRAAQSTQVTVEDMAGAFSRGAPTAANLGMSQQELAAMLGVVSERMGDTQRGGRALAMMLREIQKPTGESEAIIKELYGSVDNLQEAVAKDAVGALKELKEKLEGTNYGIEDVVTSSNALDAANMLLADGGERVSEVLGEVNNSAGAVDDAYEKSESSAREFAKAKENLAAAIRPLGTILTEMLVPALEKLSSFLSKVAEWFKKLSPTGQKIVVVVLALAAALGPVLMVIGAILPALPLLGGAFTMLMGPVGLVIAAIVGFAALATLVVKNWEPIKAFFLRIWDKIKEIFIRAWDFIKMIFFNTTVPGLIIKHWEGIKTFFANIWEGIKRIFSSAIDWLMRKIQPFINAFETVKKGVSWVGEKVGGAVTGVGNWFKNLLPSFQEGGIVPGVGAKLAMVHGGETIIPRGRGVGNINIYVQGGNYLDREAGEKFAEMLGKMLRREIRLA
jgi:TP901 family phage tail tape measure protein